MGTVTTEQSYSSMAKVLCIIAWAGLVTAAPYYEGRRAGSSVDTEAIVDTVMKSLDLNQVIAEAMKGLSGSGSSFTGTFTQLPQSTLKISGSSVGQNSLGRYSGVSTQGGSRFSLQSSNSGLSGSRSGSSVDKTAVVGKVLTVLNPQIEKAVAEAIRSASSSSSSSFGSSQQQSSSFGSSSQQSSFLGTSSGSSNFQGSRRQDESALVSQIISMLTPTITQSVKKAISSGQSSSVNQQSFMNSLSQTSGFSSGTQQSSSVGASQSTIAQQVLTALAPTITSQVQAAIASMQSSSSSFSGSSQTNSQAFQQSQAVQVSEQETSQLVRQIITT